MNTIQILSAIRDARFADGVRCPRCGGLDCPRWGRFKGRQRFMCHGCGRTFSDLTGTPAAYTKRIECWSMHAYLMKLAKPIRYVARQLEIHPSTAFRWRHRSLGPLRDDDTETLQGWTEITAQWFAWSEKGSRRLTREPRTTRNRDPWPDAREGVNVLIASDRKGHLVTALTGLAHARRLHRPDFEQGLGGRFTTPPILTMPEGRLGPGAVFADAIGGRYVDARATLRGPAHPLAHVRHVDAYRLRLLEWLAPFRGVATKYLPNYLAWHRVVDGEIRNGASVILLRWPIPAGSG